MRRREGEGERRRKRWTTYLMTENNQVGIANDRKDKTTVRNPGHEGV